MTTIIRGAHVLTAAGTDHVDGAVAVDGATITAVGPAAELLAAHPDAEVVGDGTGIVLPGLVNAHGHFSEGLTTGLGERHTLWEWLRAVISPVSPHLTAEHAEVGTLLKGAEMLQTGVTTVNDMFVFLPRHGEGPVTPGVVRALVALGLRGEVSYGARDVGTDLRPADVLAEQEALAAACADAGPLVRFRVGVGDVMQQTPPLLAESVRLAKAADAGIHVHLQEIREEVTASRLANGVTPIVHAARVGLLDAPTVAAHCVCVDDHDIAVLAEHGAAVAHNPVSNMILASGVCPVPQLRAAGIPVGIGTDGPASNDAQNQLEAVKMTVLLQRVHTLKASVLDARAALTMATIEGARALGLDAVTGSLEVGKDADVVLVDGAAPTLAAVHDPYQTVVYCLSGREVSDVWVRGRRVVAGGQPTGIDLPDVVARARTLARDLAAAAQLQDESLLAQPG